MIKNKCFLLITVAMFITVVVKFNYVFINFDKFCSEFSPIAIALFHCKTQLGFRLIGLVFSTLPANVSVGNIIDPIDLVWHDEKKFTATYTLVDDPVSRDQQLNVLSIYEKVLMNRNSNSETPTTERAARATAK